MKSTHKRGGGVHSDAVQRSYRDNLPPTAATAAAATSISFKATNAGEHN